MYVKGWDTKLSCDINYTEQILHSKQLSYNWSFAIFNYPGRPPLYLVWLNLIELPIIWRSKKTPVINKEKQLLKNKQYI